MTQEENERLVKLELIIPHIEKSLNKILENQEVVTKLNIEADANKKFRENFKREVAEIITQRLNTIQFEQALNEQIEKQVMIIFDKQDVRNDLTAKIKDTFQHEFKNIQLKLMLKLIMIIGSIATFFATMIVKGLTGGN